MSDIDIAYKVKEIQCETLILCGEKDKTNMDSAKQFHQEIKNSCLKIINQSSHEVNADNPRELSSTICEFWKSMISVNK